MANLLFICGPHCCGKTTILKRLEQEGEIDYRGSEIGKDLYYSQKFLTETQDEAFEREVANLELHRDNELASCEGILGIETWHPGNMAYASVRNPDVVPDLTEIAFTSPLLKNAFGIWIVIDKAEIRKRTKTFQGNEEWASVFYDKVNSKLETCLKLLDLYNRVSIIVIFMWFAFRGRRAGEVVGYFVEWSLLPLFFV